MLSKTLLKGPLLGGASPRVAANGGAGCPHWEYDI